MAVAKTDYGNWSTLAGTLAEVADALRDNLVPKEKVVAIYYDSGTSKTTAIYSRN